MARRMLSLRGSVRSALRERAIIAAAAAGDPYFASVVLLLDFAGADQATNITDLSNSAHVDTFVGDAEVDTDLPYIGENSVLLDGAVSDRIGFPTSPDWAMPGDFTWECGVRLAAKVTSHTFLSNFDGSLGAWIRWGGAEKLQFLMDGGLIKQEDWTPSLSTWYHVAVCREGTNLRLFVDGVQLGTPTTWADAIPQATGDFSVGAALAGSDLFGGNIGAVRITKGFARYTENFTAPTEFYPTS